MLATYLVAVCKKGTATNAFVRKIIRGINDDIGIQIDLDNATIKLVWNVYGTLIPDYKFPGHFEQLLQDILELGLHLRLTVMQTVGAGLTCFTLIKIAITTYTDFPWDSVAQILNPEFGNWLAAAAAINDDPYYGFKSDLWVAKSTLYKNLAWVAAQLLIRVGG